MHYCLYLPERRGASDDHLEAVGATSLKGTGASYADVLENGPDGGWGLHVSWDSRQIGLDERWAWSPAPPVAGLPKGRFWIGIHPEDPVTPSDLKRPEQYVSHDVQLGDSNTWAIPVAQRLPHTNGLDPETGKFVRQHSPQYRSFCDRSMRVAVDMLSAFGGLEMIEKLGGTDEQVDIGFPLDEAWSYCCEALSMNYRITPEVVNVLKLFDDESLADCMKATVDLPILMQVRAEKKSTDIVITPVTLTS